MIGRGSTGRRKIGSVLLVVFATLAVQAGFFHSCGFSGRGSGESVVDDPSLAVHNETSVCTACLLTRTLAAAEPAKAPTRTFSESSEGIELVQPFLATKDLRFPTAARSPPVR